MNAQELLGSGNLNRRESLAPGYLLVGEETYWRRKIVSAIARHFAGGPEILSGDDVTWDDLGAMLAQPSFFGPTFWVVHGAQALFSKGDPRIGEISPGNCLLLSWTSKDKTPRPFLKLWERLGGLVVEAGTLGFSDAIRWAGQEFTRAGLRPSREATEVLITTVGRSLDALEQEIAKIVLYVGKRKKTVGADAVLACVSQDPEKTSFGFVDAVLDKDVVKAADELSDLRARGVYQGLLIGLLSSQLVLVARVKEEIRKRTPQPAMAKALGAHPYTTRKALAQSRIWSEEDLQKAFFLLLSTDENIKTGMAHPDLAVDHLIAGLCRR